MAITWNPLGFRLLCYLVLIIVLRIQGCSGLNAEGVALLEFRAGVYNDPQGALVNWDPNDLDPCRWSGVRCLDGAVHILNLTGFSLEGVLLPELGKLRHLRSLVLSENRFFGNVPKEIGDLSELELLDLGDNNLNGTIPAEISRIRSLKRLFLCGNMFEGSIRVRIDRPRFVSMLQFSENHAGALGHGAERVGRKLGPRFRLGNYRVWCKNDCCNYTAESWEPSMLQNEGKPIDPLRRKLGKQSIHFAAMPANNISHSPITGSMAIQSSGLLPATPSKNTTQSSGSLALSPTDDGVLSPHDPSEEDMDPWLYLTILIPGATVLLFAGAALCLLCRNQDGVKVSRYGKLESLATSKNSAQQV